MKIAKEFHFSASHQLIGLAPDHPCMRLHGHNYVVTLVCEGTPDERGMVIDYHDLKPFGNFIDTVLDHRHLNDVFSVDTPTTAENIAVFLLTHAYLLKLPVVSVRVSETPKTYAEATLEDLPG